MAHVSHRHAMSFINAMIEEARDDQVEAHDEQVEFNQTK